jgi:hypothetical protein
LFDVSITDFGASHLLPGPRFAQRDSKGGLARHAFLRWGLEAQDEAMVEPSAGITIDILITVDILVTIISLCN